MREGTYLDRRNERTRRGFAFVELLVVLAIAVMLAAMVVPALPRAREQAQKERCAANIHTLGLGWQMLRKDCDGEWTRALCGPGRYRPQAMADLIALGYVQKLETYLCPSLSSPYPREPRIESWDPYRPDVVKRVYIGDLRGQCYFADEFRIPREPLEQRAVLADGIEMVTYMGKEPANHPGGSNVLFADLAVQWVGIYLPGYSWVMDKHKVWGADDELIGGPGHYGVIQEPRDEYFPHCRAGTWRRSGFIQNPRLLSEDPDDADSWGGAGTGEDDIPNGLSSPGSSPNDVDDIYYGDCESETWGAQYGEACRYGFVSYSFDTRCGDRKKDRSARDCSLAGGSVYNWRANFGAPWMGSSVPPECGGMTWGHPDEL